MHRLDRGLMQEEAQLTFVTYAFSMISMSTLAIRKETLSSPSGSVVLIGPIGAGGPLCNAQILDHSFLWRGPIKY